MIRGICYTADGEKYMHEAVLSAQQNKSGYPTCLITDMESTHPNIDVFNIIKRIDFSEYDAMEVSGNPLASHKFWRKLSCLIESPWDVTCYIDCDCYPVGSLDLGFEYAEEGYFANVIAPTKTFVDEGKQYILYSGAVWFAKTPIDPVIIDAFKEEIPKVGSRYWGDEGVISVACRSGKFKHAVLPNTFNLPISGHRVDHPISVVHTRHLVGAPPTRITTDYWGNEVIER